MLISTSTHSDVERFVIMIWMMFIPLLLPSEAQRAPTWDACNCSWVTWEPWSICSKNCYGRQVRTRKVRVLDTPACGTFESCDYGDGGREYQTCNARCTQGTYDAGYGTYGGCRCPAGRYDDCCSSVVTCGSPLELVNGGLTTSDGWNYGSVVTYTCNEDYNITGHPERTCTTQNTWSMTGIWTGSTPLCQYAESCKSSPCVNGGTCINGLDSYTCMCLPGWTGLDCQTDVQPPVVEGCENSSTLHTAAREVNHQWTVPSFSDPHGNDVTTTSNYGGNSYSFPWGDFVVQYVSTKPSNGLQTECKFEFQVRPFPCSDLPTPTNGYVACNDWRDDYGQFCLIGCLANFSIPRDVDERQWYVCGSSGSWTPSLPAIECEVSSEPDGLLGKPVDCTDSSVLASVSDNYVEELKASSFNAFCLDHPNLCTRDNVKIQCG